MTRVISAAVLAALVLATVWWLPWWVTLVMAALAAAEGGRELARLAPHGASLLTGAAAAAATVAVVLEDPRVPWFHPGALAAVLLGVVVLGGWLAIMGQTPSGGGFVRAATIGFGAVYVGVPLGALAWVRSVEGAATLTWLLLVMTASDSGQYYVGRAVGRRPLARAISPGKTVEGAIGGLAAALVVGALTASWGIPAVGAVPAVALAVILSMVGMAGDLFESFLKRSAGVKDSASLIPGHGGLLDRIDGYLFAAPVFYLALRHVL